MSSQSSWRERCGALEWHCDLAFLRLQVVAWRCRLVLKAGFKPDQPRGDRGRWTADRSDAADTAASDYGIIQVADSGSGFEVDILEEGEVGAHIYARHVNKSDDFLLGRVRSEGFANPFFSVVPKRAGTFPSVAAANKLINSTLSENSGIVAGIIAGKRAGGFIVKTFGSPTGREAFRPSARAQPYIRDTDSVAVLIAHDKTVKRGFRIITAYPMFDD